MENWDKFQSLLRNGQFKIIPKAGHSIQGDNPTDFNNTVLAFLDSMKD
jgi:pimeloyl-ACP methyl ester carboxylesterase